MSPLPTPARRVLTELAGLYLMEVGPTHAASPVQRTFSTLLTQLDAQAVALAEIDRIEADLVAHHGYPRVALPTQSGALPLYATDATTIQHHLGTGPAGRRSIANLRRWQRRFMEAAEAAGLPAAHTSERKLATRVDDTAASLLLAPTIERADLTRKLIVLIAMCEPGAVDSTAFPGAYLRTLLVDLVRPNKTTGADR